MTKQQLLDKLEKAWADSGVLRRVERGADDTPGVTGTWSVKISSRTLPPGKRKRLNICRSFVKANTALCRPLRWAERLQRADEREKARAVAGQCCLARRDPSTTGRYIQNAPDDLIATETRFRHRIRLDTYSHYPEHARAIRGGRSAWLMEIFTPRRKWIIYARGMRSSGAPSAALA